MVIIIEGLDCTGKTTLSKRFSEKYNFTYIKESYTDSDIEKVNRLNDLFKRVVQNDQNYIYDRTTVIDDFVYDFLNEKQSSLQDYKDLIYAILSQCKIIHLILDEKTRLKRFNERGDQYITNDMIEQIRTNYVRFYTNVKNVHFYDLTKDIEKDVQNIMEVVKND